MESMEGRNSDGNSASVRDTEGDGPITTNRRTKAAFLWRNLRSNVGLKGGIWQEMSGSVGDIGTFLPILLALSLVNGVNFGTTLIFTGIYNLITGGLFGVPMPVQPMKSIAAVAITEGDPLTVPQIMAAGITTAAVLLFLGATGLMTLVQRLVPLSLVRGIQLSQGISFGLTAVKYVVKDYNLKTSKGSSDRGWTGSDGLLLAFSAFFFVILFTGAGGSNSYGEGNGNQSTNSVKQDATVKNEEDPESANVSPIKETTISTGLQLRARTLTLIPTALIIFIVGVIIAIARDTKVFRGWVFGPSAIHTVHISAHDWRTGFVRAAVPQIPLSIFNSVIAVCKLSKDLFPDKKFVTPAHVSVSVGLMNLVGCWFGAMPVCHGCGGLAGQYRFGARTGLSVVILGSVKLLVGLVFGSSLLRLLSNFPVGLLGVLLFFSGLELAMACRDMSTRMEAFVMLVVTFVALGTSNLTKGFVIGLMVWAGVKINQLFIEARWPRREDFA
ncbi:unnamed protein product [Calypogeia fissa]